MTVEIGWMIWFLREGKEYQAVIYDIAPDNTYVNVYNPKEGILIVYPNNAIRTENTPEGAVWLDMLKYE